MCAAKLRPRLVIQGLASAAAILAGSGCALLDPTSYGFVYAPNIRSAEGQVATDSGLQQGRWRFKGDAGQVISEGDYVDDVRTGPWADYYDNGNPRYLYTLKDSRRDGLFQSWHPNAKLATAGHFVEGYQFGQWTFHDTAGRLAETGAFLDDHREGRWVKYHKDGSAKLTELHFDGDRVGHWQLFDQSGDVTDIWNDMPEGLEWSSELWPDSDVVRREGFLMNGEPVGLWKTFHRDGLLRAIGAFEGGAAVGPWHLYSQAAELIARGSFERNRPTGEWIIASGGSAETVDATTFQSGLPFVGSWSDAALASAEPIGVVVSTWVEEAASTVAPSTLVSQAPDEAEEANVEWTEEVAEAIEEADEEPDVPVPAHAFTEKEQKSYANLVDYYGGAKSALAELRSLYRGSRSTRKTSAQTLAFPEEGGDLKRAARFVGKPLPMTEFYSADGTIYDLNRLKGRNVVLVILRGFDGEICPYCVAQTESLCKQGALKKFDERSAELVVVFPGSMAGLETFQESYEMLAKKSRDAYRIRYANAHDIAVKFDLVGEKVLPSTMILDHTGTVRFAYVGTKAEDRPTLPLLVRELDRIDAE